MHMTQCASTCTDMQSSYAAEDVNSYNQTQPSPSCIPGDLHMLHRQARSAACAWAGATARARAEVWAPLSTASPRFLADSGVGVMVVIGGNGKKLDRCQILTADGVKHGNSLHVSQLQCLLELLRAGPTPYSTVQAANKHSSRGANYIGREDVLSSLVLSQSSQRAAWPSLLLSYASISESARSA